MLKTTFFDLPAELRLKIYSLALPLPQNEVIRPLESNRRRPIADPFYKIFEPGPFAVNRQIREETLAMYYGHNTFHLQDYFSATKYLRALGTLRLSMIEQFVLGYFECRPSNNAEMSYVTCQIRHLRQWGGDACRALRKEAYLMRWDGTSYIRVIDCAEIAVVGEGEDWMVERKEVHDA